MLLPLLGYFRLDNEAESDSIDGMKKSKSRAALRLFETRLGTHAHFDDVYSTMDRNKRRRKHRLLQTS